MRSCISQFNAGASLLVPDNGCETEHLGCDCPDAVVDITIWWTPEPWNPAALGIAASIFPVD